MFDLSVLQLDPAPNPSAKLPGHTALLLLLLLLLLPPLPLASTPWQFLQKG